MVPLKYPNNFQISREITLINGKINLILTSSVDCVIMSAIVFSIPKYQQNELKFKGVNTGINLWEIKNGNYVTNLDKYKAIGTHWVALYVNGKNITYVDSFGVEYVPKKLKYLQEKNYCILYTIMLYLLILC